MGGGGCGYHCHIHFFLLPVCSHMTIPLCIAHGTFGKTASLSCGSLIVPNSSFTCLARFFFVYIKDQLTEATGGNWRNQGCQV